MVITSFPAQPEVLIPVQSYTSGTYLPQVYLFYYRSRKELYIWAVCLYPDIRPSVVPLSAKLLGFSKF